METKVSIRKHPLHPMLVPVPIGLWVFSLVCDFIHHGTGNVVWSTIALYSLVGGIIGALLAAVPGMLDLYNLQPSAAKRIGLYHMGINLSLVTLYVINYLWREHTFAAAMGPVILSLFSVIVLAVSGWLGGEMVYRYGVGVGAVKESVEHKPASEDHHDSFWLRLHHRH